MTATEDMKTEEPKTEKLAKIDAVTFRIELTPGMDPCDAAASDDNRKVRPHRLLITARNGKWEIQGLGVPTTRKGLDYKAGDSRLIRFCEVTAQRLADSWIEEILSQTEMRSFDLPPAPVPLLTPSESDKIGVLGSMFGDDVSAWPAEVREKAKADGLLRFEQETSAPSPD